MFNLPKICCVSSSEHAQFGEPILHRFTGDKIPVVAFFRGAVFREASFWSVVFRVTVFRELIFLGPLKPNATLVIQQAFDKKQKVKK